jgi:hypothetical protein
MNVASTLLKEDVEINRAHEEKPGKNFGENCWLTLRRKIARWRHGGSRYERQCGHFRRFCDDPYNRPPNDAEASWLCRFVRQPPPVPLHRQNHVVGCTQVALT